MLIAWPITRQGHWMAWIVSLLNLGFIVGVGILFVPSVTDMLDFFKMIPPWRSDLVCNPMDNRDSVAWPACLLG